MQDLFPVHQDLEQLTPEKSYTSVAYSLHRGQSTSHLQAWVSMALKCGRGDGYDIHRQVCHVPESGGKSVKRK